MAPAAPLDLGSLLLCQHCRRSHPMVKGHTEGTPYTQAMLYFVCRGARRTIAIVAVLAGIGCGSPTSPAHPILQGPGPYWLDVIGFAISTDPDVPPCLAPVTAFTFVRVRLDVTKEGALWVARSPSAFGDLELRIRGDGEVTGGTEVSGSVRGTALDTETRPVSDVRVRIGAATAASVEGLAERTGRFIRGTFFGDIQYINSVGNITQCTAVIWTLQPAPF